MEGGSVNNKTRRFARRLSRFARNTSRTLRSLIYKRDVRDPSGGPCGVFEGLCRSYVRRSEVPLATEAFFGIFRAPGGAPTPISDKSRLCKKMCTVIAVIFHPSRAPKSSIRQRYDHFSVQAAQNPQTKTTFSAIILLVRFARSSVNAMFEAQVVVPTGCSKAYVGPRFHPSLLASLHGHFANNIRNTFNCMIRGP